MADEFLRIDLDNDRWVSLRFEKFPEELRDDLLDEIEDLTAELYLRERAAIPVRTGKMQGQLKKKVWNDPKRIKGVVDFDGKGSGSGSDFAKYGALEYGSTGRPFKVRAHPMQLTHFLQHQFDAPMRVLVKAHERIGKIREHRFARGTLEAMTPEILERLNAVVERATAAANEGEG